MNPIRQGDREMKILALVVLLLQGAIPCNAFAASLVGVLEEPQCRYGVGRFVRPLFLSKGGAWLSLDSAQAANPYIQKQMSWSIAFDGRKVGTLQTSSSGFNSPDSWIYKRDHLLKLASGDLAPSVANKSDQFWGWCQRPSVRPLVVVSDENVEDPEKWKPTAISSDDLKQVFDEFKRHAGIAFVCANTLEQGVPFDYGPQDIEALKSYKDSAGRRLITVRLKNGSNCDGPIDKSWGRHSFLATKNNIAYLGVGLELVDAGDYDGDGTSELLFWFSGYNHDGYMLYSTEAAGMIEFTWKYH